MTDVQRDAQHAFDTIARLEQQAREDARREAEPPEPATPERTLAAASKAASSQWLTFKTGSDQ